MLCKDLAEKAQTQSGVQKYQVLYAIYNSKTKLEKIRGIDGFATRPILKKQLDSGRTMYSWNSVELYMLRL